MIARMFSLLLLISLSVPGQDLPFSYAKKQYKKVHLDLLKGYLQGYPKEASRELHAYTDEHGDMESLYTLAVFSQWEGDQDNAFEYLQQALDAGLQPGRLIAGSRNLLQDLAQHPKYQQLLKDYKAPLVHGPLLGKLTPTSVSLWVRTADPTSIHAQVGITPNFTESVSVGEGRTTAEADHTGTITLTGFQPSTRYYYRVRLDAADGPVVADSHFTTAPLEGQPAKFEIVFGGGAGYTPDNERMWDTINRRTPLAFLALGDNIYPDAPEFPTIQRYAYYRRQSRPEFRRFTAQTPTFAVWDDHDFADNDSWGGPEIDTPAWKRPVWEVFTQNWVNPYYGGGVEQLGCWFHTQIADVDFIFLDSRCFRTDPTKPDKTLLGPVQKAWFFDRLKQSTGAFKMICSPIPMAPGTKGGSLDTWDGFPEERDEITSFLTKNKIEGVVILTADRHRSDVWRIDRPNDYPLYEFESSRLTNLHVHEKQKGALFSYNESQSYGHLAFDTTAEDPTLTYTIMNIDGEEIHQHTVKRSELE